jgi:hypothetical protein
MLTGIHILLTLKCTNECDHCFLHCSPSREATFTIGQLRALIDQIKELGGVTIVYFCFWQADLAPPWPSDLAPPMSWSFPLTNRTASAIRAKAGMERRGRDGALNPFLGSAL